MGACVGGPTLAGHTDKEEVPDCLIAVFEAAWP
jgi:hypothetical protein